MCSDHPLVQMANPEVPRIAEKVEAASGRLAVPMTEPALAVVVVGLGATLQQYAEHGPPFGCSGTRLQPLRPSSKADDAA